MKDVGEFSLMWTHSDVLCSAEESQLFFSEVTVILLCIYLLCMYLIICLSIYDHI